MSSQPQVQPARALPHRFELTGSLSAIALPQICPNCGSPATVSVWVESSFTRTHSEGSNTYLVAGISLPLCTECIAAHRREARVITPLDRFFLCFKTSTILAAIAPALFALFMIHEYLEDLATGHGSSLILLGVAAVCMLISYGCFVAAFRETERYAVIPRTSVTSAFEFGDDRSELFEPERRHYWIRDPSFAEAFEALNQTRVWHPKSRSARSAGQKRNVLYVCFGAAVILVLTWDWLRNFLDHL